MKGIFFLTASSLLFSLGTCYICNMLSDTPQLIASMARCHEDNLPAKTLEMLNGCMDEQSMEHVNYENVLDLFCHRDDPISRRKFEAIDDCYRVKVVEAISHDEFVATAQALEDCMRELRKPAVTI